jgi:hypothetical protein
MLGLTLLLGNGFYLDLLTQQECFVMKTLFVILKIKYISFSFLIEFYCFIS